MLCHQLFSRYHPFGTYRSSVCPDEIIAKARIPRVQNPENALFWPLRYVTEGLRAKEAHSGTSEFRQLMQVKKLAEFSDRKTFLK